MLLTCPHCETIFRVETADIKTGGRRVRCSVCSHIWEAKRGGANVATEDADLIQQLKSWRLTAGMIVLAIVLTATLSIYRHTISALSPPMVAIYQSMGLTISPDLTVVDVGRLSATRRRDTIRVLGEVTNISGWPVHSPDLLVTVSDQFGAVLAEKTISLDAPVMAGDTVMAFTTQITLEKLIDDDVVTEIIVVPVLRPVE